MVVVLQFRENTRDIAPEQTLLSLSEVHTHTEGQHKVHASLTSHLIPGSKGGVSRCANLRLAFSTTKGDFMTIMAHL